MTIGQQAGLASAFERAPERRRSIEYSLNGHATARHQPQARRRASMGAVKASPEPAEAITMEASTPSPDPEPVPSRPSPRSYDSRKSATYARSVSRTLSWGGARLDENQLQERAMRITGTHMDELMDGLSQGQPAPQTSLQNAILALQETFLIFRLAVLLYSYLGLGTRWMGKLIRLIVYSVLLLPGFIQMGIFYFLSPRVTRSLVYGLAARNRLDLYRPPSKYKRPPEGYKVVIYITGGAWTIGYKAWGSLLGRRLSKAKVLVYCLDYRNFPQGTMLDMMRDVNTGIRWILHHTHFHGGDPNQVYLVGQSCGAQLAAMALITQAEQSYQKAQLPGGFPAWQPQRVRAMVGISGVYNCFDLADHFNRRGLYRKLFDNIMSVNGQPNLKLFSPTYCIKGVEWGKSLPPVLLLHGTSDTCALVSNATQFSQALEEAGAQVELKYYDGETHTSPLIENPMRGGHDKLVDDILACVFGHNDLSPWQMPLCPGFLINIAAWICPF
ncbi:g6725 [Coccomyxa viridis]|uniref:protein-S-isoprenylcysteine alpha-carbonyl methylesterase n=1 Tax=Coccomyxa viridis TaxID=1274662 RepID=A0ABP1FXB2_9CHLO